VADSFVRVRLLRIQNVDLNLYEFDWDLTWAAFFMHADGKIYGRYGGRDGSGADSRNTLAGLRYAMQAALETHRECAAAPPPVLAAPLFIDRVPTAKRFRSGECIHCHQVKEILRADEMDKGTWKRDSLWTYPLPENIGITLDKDRGNVVRKVTEKSPAAQAGVQAGDLVDAIGALRVRSFADAQHALHKAPWKGDVAIAWKRGDKMHEAKLALAEGWKKTNPTWRPSMLDLFPALTIYGTDLTKEEKRKAGLDPEQMAFRQMEPVHARAAAMGVKAGDVIFGMDNQKLKMTVDEFLGHVRRNHIAGDRITLNVLRAGKRVDLPLKLGN
jgi:hypothetical protein